MNSKLAIYDVRGIQKYIFSTNKVKEIVGASKIVDNLIINEFRNAINELKINKKVLIDWDKQEEYLFDKDKEIEIEVLYYGGGNLVVLFRKEEILEKVSILMARNIMQKAYGLSLVYAYVDKTDNYNEDFKKLKEKLSEIKAVTPLNRPAGIVPIVAYDRITGKPLSKEYSNEKVSYESYQKLKKFENDQENSDYIKEFDKMRTSETEGLIAIVHIDGNSMGMNIKNIMNDVKTYDEAVNRLRKISKDIHQSFEINALDKVKAKIPEIAKKHGIKIKDKLPFRPLIQAGDDITFVCNERLALDIVIEYINAIKKDYMHSEEYVFSACAGIAIIHSHYPFYKGYQIAEECCQSAKRRAKNEGVVNNKIGNFIDFEYCYTNNTSDLDDIRSENYYSIDGNYLLKRPYGIYEENQELTDEQKIFDIKTFNNNLNKFKNIPRSVAKLFRDAYYEDEAAITKTMLKEGKKLKINFKPYTELNGKKYTNYFDALELLDVFGGKKDE